MGFSLIYAGDYILSGQPSLREYFIKGNDFVFTFRKHHKSFKNTRKRPKFLFTTSPLFRSRDYIRTSFNEFYRFHIFKAVSTFLNNCKFPSI